jgi:DNA gyrase subunit A
MNTDCITGAISVDSESEILMITSNGQAVRCPVNNIRETNRGSKGVKLVNLSGRDKLIAVSEVIELDEGDDADEIAENIEDTDENTSESDLSGDQTELIE